MNGFVSIIFFVAVATFLNTVTATCDKELNNCLATRKCRKVLSNVLEKKCKSLFSNFNYFSSESSKISCSKTCKKTLRRAKRGSLHRLLTCSSNTSEYFPYQDRAMRCLMGEIKEQPHDNFVENGCSRIFKQCTNYHHCRRRYEKMMYKCNGMLLGSNCTSDCENALQGFLTSKKTFGFFKCQCDGAFYFQKTCHSLKKNIMTQCASKGFKLFLKERQVTSQ